MLEITINHDGKNYMIDVWCDKQIRHTGLYFTAAGFEILDMIEEILLDYKGL